MQLSAPDGTSRRGLAGGRGFGRPDRVVYDDAHGGWFGAVRYDGPVGTTNRADEHAFVVLDAPSDVVAGRASAGALLADARNVLGRRFWREDERMLAKSWDAGWTEPGSHRG